MDCISVIDGDSGYMDTSSPIMSSQVYHPTGPSVQPLTEAQVRFYYCFPKMFIFGKEDQRRIALDWVVKEEKKRFFALTMFFLNI